MAETVQSSHSQVPGISGPLDGYLTRLDANGQVLWQSRFGGTGRDTVSAIVAHGESLFVAGVSDSLQNFGDPAVGTDGYVASLDSAGTLAWVTRMPGGPRG